MKLPPKPRKRIFDIYWQFAFDRHKAFERRISGLPGPWTPDPIIQTFKFCNVYRACDRVSQYLIRDVAYRDEGCAPEDRIFQIVAFRLFSRIETWEEVVAFLGGQPLLSDLRSGAFLAAVEHAKVATGGLYTSAFILCATNAYGHSQKHRNHDALLKDMFLSRSLGERIVGADSLKAVYDLFHTFPLIGDFMAYQLAVDVNYSGLLNHSENDFTQPGPGAIRGLRKVFEDLRDYSASDAIQWVVERQDDEFRERGLDFRGLWGRKLHAIDCQGLFCETDKYCREAAPELLSSRKRIKARFIPSSEPLPLFFPPKWGLNSLLPKKVTRRKPRAARQQRLPA